jgi:hypothetical protein
MKFDYLTFPVPVHPTWEIIDTSKIKTYLDCPRQFFWRYVLGWDSTAPSNHLVFGEAFHRAMAYLLLNDYSNKSISIAYQEHFLPYYRKHFPPSTDELMKGKTPDAIPFALIQYAEKYKQDFNNFEIHYVEIAGAAPVTEDELIHLRMDAVCEDRHGLFALEHKTGSGISRFWTDQWDLDLQPGTYSHAVRCAFPDQNVRGTMINGIHFKKLKAGPKIELMRMPIWKSNDLMLSWHSTIVSALHEIKNDFEFLSKHTGEEVVMDCFRMNPGTCTKYTGCAYKNFCCSWANPLKRIDQVQMGFEIKFWDPRAGEVKHQLETLGDNKNDKIKEG